MSRRALGSALYCCVSVLLGVGLGLAVAVVYAYDYHSGYDGLSVVSVYPQTSYAQPGDTCDGGARAADELTAWAKESGAVILYKPLSSFGCGVCTGADGPFGAGAEGVLVADGEGMDAAYVRDGVLFPGYLDWEVRGGFDPSSLPEELSGAAFLYPLSYASELEGTIVTNSRQVDDIAALLVRRGYSASVVSKPLELTEPSWGELASRFASGSDFAKIAAVVGLILLACSLISAGRHLRDGRERMWVRHLYGLTIRRMMGGAVALALALDCVQLLTLWALLRWCFGALGPAGTAAVMLGAACAYLLRDALTCLLAWRHLVRGLARREAGS